MKNFIQPGEAIDLTAPEAIVSGSLITAGEALVGVAVADAASGDLFSINTKGVYALAKGAVAFSLGDKVMVATGAFNNGENVVADDGNGVHVGVVVEDAASGAATVKVRLVGS